MEAYDLIKRHFEHLMSLHIIHVFFQTLKALEIFIISRGIKDDFGEASMWEPFTILMIWILQNLYMESTVGYECETFYVAMKNSRITCLRLKREVNLSAKERSILKNICRIQDARLVTWKSRLGDPHQDIRQSERCFVVLLEAYNLFKSHFEILISLQTVHVLLRALNALRRFLLTRRIFDDIGETTMWISLSLLAIWILKNMYLQTIFGYECEQFYFEMEDSMAVCIRLENMNRTSKKHQRILRNIRRLQKASFSKVSACGTFDFDARLPLKMAGALATFALFFLQFFFMK
ncbi:hypothetical protein NE865_06498 [Phthorimaea operculella]|nr:hypothetical protein NE865_06498 [Phthorimaea operculella]